MIGEGTAKVGTADQDAGWNDISGEAYRVYVFPNGEYRVDNPRQVKIKRKPEGDSHRVISRDENNVPTSHYVPAGWLGIRWEGIDGAKEFSW